MINETLLTCDRETTDTISAILKRMRAELSGVTIGGLDLVMDLTVCHNKGHVDLPTLLATDTGTLAHDLSGIVRHLDRGTGEMTDCFVPRCRKAVAIQN